MATRVAPLFLTPTTPPPADFAKVTIEIARELAPSLEEATANRPFIEGKHLNNGDFWIGPGPLQGDPRYQSFFTRLERLFISKNVIVEADDRLVSAVAGREPAWAWVPRRTVTDDAPITDVERALIDEVEAATTEWWDAREVHKMLKRLAFTLLWAQQSCWRLYVPSGLTDDRGAPNVADLTGALAKIFLDVPDPETAFVYENPNTKQRVGVVFFQDALGKDAVELTFIGDQGKTVIKILPDSAATVNESTNDFGGHLTVFQVAIDRPLITEQVRSLQKALNMTLTLLGKGLVDEHFTERIFFDTLPPGQYEYEDDGVTVRSYKANPAGRATGGKVDSYMESVHVTDPETGRVIQAKGNVTIREPNDPARTIKGVEYWYQAILEEVRQDHILTNQQVLSGKSREEARGDFADSGKDTEMQIEMGGRELLATAVAMAEAFMKTPGKYTRTLRPVFKCRAKYGRLSVEERNQNITESEKGFLSNETAMSANGTDDVDAELNLIAAQPGARVKLSGERADVVAKWATDFPREVALHLADFTDDEITEIMARVADAAANDPTPAPTTTPPNPIPGAVPPSADNPVP